MEPEEHICLMYYSQDTVTVLAKVIYRIIANFYFKAPAHAAGSAPPPHMCELGADTMVDL